MADKRISQLVDRGTVANNDVVPIVVSGASTTNKATISSIQTFMQGNLDMGVTSVGLSMPSAFVVSNSPVTGSGNISVTGAGTVSQYIRGDGSLADFPQGGGGGGASVNYYLNGSVSQGTIGGIAYKEMNRVPVLGAGTDFVAIADGYLASFITDAGDPALLEIPAGNWNFETYFSASSGGGTPSFYVELYKVDSGGTATLIASNSGTPELIAFGTTITPYFSTLAVPTTSLTLTDRLALRYYVARSGRTITLHTENSHLCQIITTFTTGLTALNGLTAQVQNFATGTSGTDFNISSASTTHTFNLPDASATARGLITTGSQTFAGAKTFNSSVTASSLIRTGGTSSQFLKADGSVDSNTYLTTGTAASTYITIATPTTITGVKTFASLTLNLAAAGTSNATIFSNSSADQTSMAGVNFFGFNSNNNIYFNKGTTLNAGFLVFNNTAARTYTLPDASGTLAFTSQIPANLITGTGATGQVAYWNGTNSQTGSNNLFWDNANIKLGIGTNTPEGTGLTVAGGGVLVSLDSGAARKVLELYATSTGAKVSSTYVGASSYGSLELLTSNVARLTIADTGGATFTNSLRVENNAITQDGTRPIFTLQQSGTTKVFLGISSSSSDLVTGDSSGDAVFRKPASSGAFRFSVDGGTSSAFSIASTGAATFSSSVTTGSHISVVNGSINFGGSGSAPSTDPAIYRIGGVNDLAFAIGSTERMRITSGGELRVTASNVGVALYQSLGNGEIAAYNWGVGGGWIPLVHGGSQHIFNTSGTERMRITSGGYLKASNTGSYQSAAAGYHELRTNKTNDWIVYNTNTSASPYGLTIDYTSAAPNGGDNWFIYCNDSTTSPRFRVASNGNVTNTNGSYGAISDIKLKENIEDATPKLDDLMKVKVRNYNLIGDDKKQIGVIAQELEEVFPAMIDESEDYEEVEVPQVDEEGNEILNEEGEVVTTKERVSKGTTTKSVKYSVFVPMLIKAMQEQQEQIKELKTEIDSLKNQMQ
jgi:hypothetical protein